MSGLAAFLQNELVNLSQESKKKNNDIKEAAERVLYILRALKDKASSSSAPPGVDVVAQELSKTDEPLRPFLLSCQTKNPKLVTIAVGYVYKLISHRAIPEKSVSPVLKALSELVATPMDLQLKVLQTILPLFNNYESVHGEVLAECLALCFKLQESKSPVVSNTAAATIRQLVIHIFDKVSKEDERFPGNTLKTERIDLPVNHNALNALLPCARDAFSFFQDLCLMTVGETGGFMQISGISKGFGLELIESILNNHPGLFKQHPELKALLKDRICPMVIKSFSDKNDFAMTVRLTRLAHTVTKQFIGVLSMECEIFMSMFIKVLEAGDQAPLWHRVLVLEVYKSICNDINLLRAIFNQYDAKDHSVKIFYEITAGFGRVIVSEKHYLLQASSSMAGESPTNTGGVLGSALTGSGGSTESYAVTFAGSSIKIPCIDQLDKSDPPSFPDTYPLNLAIQCLANMVESQATVVPILRSPSTTPSETEKNDIIVAIEMAKASWGGILGALNFLITGSVDDDLFGLVTRSFTNFTGVIGLLGLVSHRDAFIGSLCKVCVPSSAVISADMPNLQNVSGFSLFNIMQAPSVKPSGNLGVLTDRNVVCLRSLLTIAYTLTPILEDKAWYLILETLEVADGLLAAGKWGKAARDDLAKAGAAGAQPIENQYVLTQTLIKKLFDMSKDMGLRSFAEFIKALCQLCRSTVSRDGGPGSERDTLGKDTKGAEEKSFAIAKLQQVAMLNATRLMTSTVVAGEADGAKRESDTWTIIMSELIQIAHAPNYPMSVRLQVCQTFSEVLTGVCQASDLKDPSVEMKILEPVKQLMLGTTPSAPVYSMEERERIMKSGWFFDIQKCGLETLFKILQTSGQNLSHGWELVFEIVQTPLVTGAGSAKKRFAKSVTPSGSIRNFANSTDVADEPAVISPVDSIGASAGQALPSGTAILKNALLVRNAFPILQLICTDFLSLLSLRCLYDCIESLGGFGSQNEDLNIGLTAIGLLWSVGDFVLTKRQGIEGSASPHLTAEPITADTLDGPITVQSLDLLWMYLLSHLSQLCADTRPEVRNSSNQTLFRTITMNGPRLTLEAWSECIWKILFPLLERVKLTSDRVEQDQKELTGEGIELPTRDRPLSISGSLTRVSVSKKQVSTTLLSAVGASQHHSRNTMTKQWDETKVLTLGGVTKTLIDFFPLLLKLGKRFDEAWSLLLDYIKTWCLCSSPEVSMAAIKAFRSLVRYPIEQGGFKAIEGVGSDVATENRLIALWKTAWDIWEAIGLGVIDSTDEARAKAAAATTDEGPSSSAQSLSQTAGSSKVLRGSLYHGTFSQEALAAYATLSGDIYESIATVFTLNDYRRLAYILVSLAGYHTNPLPALASSRMRLDFSSDLDNLTAVQTAILEVFVGELGDSSDADAGTRKPRIRIERIEGAPECAITALCAFALMPLVRVSGSAPRLGSDASLSAAAGGGPESVAPSANPSGVASTVGTDPASKSNYTFIALSRRSMELLKIVYDQYSARASIYTTGCFDVIVESLGELMKCKYQCPPVGNKDGAVALWKLASNAFLSIAKTGMPELEKRFVGGLPQTVLDEVYAKVIDNFDGVLLPKSKPPATATADDLATDEVFDISVLQTIETFVVPHMAQSHVSDKVLATLIQIATRGASYLENTAGLDGDASAPLDGQPSALEPVRRAKFATECFEVLFGFCAEVSLKTTETEEARTRVAEIAVPALIQKAKVVLKTFQARSSTAEGAAHGALQLAFVQETQFLLEHLAALNVRPGVLIKTVVDLKVSPIRSHILSGRSAHLFCIYHDLCDCLSVLSASKSAEEAAVTAAIKLCLEKIGKELGLDSVALSF
ncbi:uncharacterized protein BJ171DRAFT_512568 [Polychytrium aggregatum]|uniref:uncharacterized protein n=1 Tax=Polychytrium aggregatum TaxID=110093 RepID=UPI0022FDB545|nr:uncharacterized protein BJ171DRAFT_512568 [Polychytrium aggregatum]KAI9202905.1 hypothetical protein BJ171DRAFT_512568 [Polychytrium aggregatum]